MQVLDTINEIDRCLEALQHKLEYLRGCVSGSLYQVDQLMTRKEAAAFICKTPRHLDRLCAENKITKEIVDGQILINGETYKEGKDFPVISNPGMASSAITLEAGEYFVLGDNRNNSEDSRYGSIGKVNKKYITGKLWFKIFPVKSLGFFE